jgi:tetratricopeptide (TPR) repeat protein
LTAGYVYVLVNSSMPGLLKVGKTTRTVAERCAELTSATGVPTPFVVAFEQHFEDCDTAEQAIHAELARKGLRQSGNREFFQGSANDVVRLILATPGISSPRVGEDERAGEVWGGLFSEAKAAEERPGNLFGDNEEAKRLYVSAAQLGAPLGYQMAGRIAAWRNPPDYRAAIALYKKGAEQGDYGCYWRLAAVFEDRGENWEARTAWEKYFELRATRTDNRFEGAVYFEQLCAAYIKLCLRIGMDPNLPSEAQNDDKVRAEIYEEAIALAVGPSLDETGDGADRDWLKTVHWIENHFLLPTDPRILRKTHLHLTSRHTGPLQWIRTLIG